jgi:hypothetical protein
LCSSGSYQVRGTNQARVRISMCHLFADCVHRESFQKTFPWYCGCENKCIFTFPHVCFAGICVCR